MLESWISDENTGYDSTKHLFLIYCKLISSCACFTRPNSQIKPTQVTKVHVYLDTLKSNTVKSQNPTLEYDGPNSRVHGCYSESLELHIYIFWQKEFIV